MNEAETETPVKEQTDNTPATETQHQQEQTQSDRVYMETFGCQMNMLDSELILGDLRSEGYRSTEEKEKADVILYNTCSIRDHAEQKALSHIGYLKHLKEKKPELVIGVVGCMAQRRGESLIQKFPHVDMVLGTDQYNEIPNIINDIRTTRDTKVSLERTDEVDMDEPPRYQQYRTSQYQAYVMAMKGCGCKCTFCVVPATRGKDVSRYPEEIRRELQDLAEQGVREVTLLGQNITEYGKNMEGNIDREGTVFQDPDKWEYNLERLLREVHDVDGIRRIRFVTSHPSFATEGLLEAMAELPEVMPYLHIPVQSGSNRMLKKMARGYTRERYIEVCEKAREIVPDINIASDFIVGFPGETEEDFEKSKSLIDEVELGQSYIFKYSTRPNTPAKDVFEDDIPDEVKNQRNNELLDVQNEVSHRRHLRMIGDTKEVLVEGPSKTDDTRWAGRTPQNEIVVFPIGEEDLEGEFVDVKIESATPLTLYGSRVEESS